jgi:hypothetical protein
MIIFKQLNPFKIIQCLFISLIYHYLYKAMFIKILQFNTMMRFNRGFGVINRYFGSTHSDPSIPKVKDLT